MRCGLMEFFIKYLGRSAEKLKFRRKKCGKNAEILQKNHILAKVVLLTTLSKEVRTKLFNSFNLEIFLVLEFFKLRIFLFAIKNHAKKIKEVLSCVQNASIMRIFCYFRFRI